MHKDKLINLIEPHFHKDLKLENYSVKTFKARKLLSNTRLDLAFKLLFLDLKDKNFNYAKKVYTDHIRAFSLGEFTEPGNAHKNSINRYLEDFYKTFENIEENGFDCTESLIPLSPNMSIANGSHRVASAIYLDKNIDCVQIETRDEIYNYKYFYNRNVSSKVMDSAVTKFVEYADNVHIAFIWPTAQGHDNEIEELIPNIVYRKSVKLNANGAHNLLSQIYYGEDWLGDIENDFSGSQGKFVECFKTLDSLRVVAFQANSLGDVLKIKDHVRDLFNVGKHSIHITDTKQEAIRVARLIFNDNSINFLNYAKPNKYISTHIKLIKYRIFIEENELKIDDLVLDGGLVLSLYGLRESSDIDYLVCGDSKIEKYDEVFENHDEELRFHSASKEDLIYNPERYFYFGDIKFVSFTQLYEMKKNRHGEKDINDCKMMVALIDSDMLGKLVSKLRQSFYYGKIKLLHKCLRFLKKINLYFFARKIYRLAKRKK
jgi:hypothetical protein